MNIYFMFFILTCFWLKVLPRLPSGSHIQRERSPPSRWTGRSPAAMAAAPSRATSLRNGVTTNLTLKELTRGSAQPHLFWLKILMNIKCMSSVSKLSTPVVKVNHPCLLTWSYKMMKVWNLNIILILVQFTVLPLSHRLSKHPYDFAIFFLFPFFSQYPQLLNCAYLFEETLSRLRQENLLTYLQM